MIVAQVKLGFDRSRVKAGWIDGQPGVKVEAKAAIRVDVGIKQRCDAPEIVDVEPVLSGGFGEHLLDREGVDIDERELQQME